MQEIVDRSFVLTTSFVKQLGGLHGGDWTARISVDVLVKKTFIYSTIISFFFNL